MMTRGFGIAFIAFLILCCSYGESDEVTDKSGMESYDLIVVGLGTAGLTALTAAARGGRRALGLEAGARLGGRVCTTDFAGGVVELGAEWIHGTEGSKVYELATSYNVTTILQDLEFSVFRSDGVPGDAAVVNELLNVCVAAIEAPPQSAEPVGQYVVKKCNEYISQNKSELLKDPDFVSEFYEFMNLLTDNYESSNDWNDVTTSSNYTELPGHQHMSWHKYGYKTLFEILLNTYKNGPGLPNMDIKLSHPVTNIRWDTTAGSDVTVTASGRQFRAKSVLITVSVGVLKEQHATLFTPPLPQTKIDAINHITIGVMDKIILSFSEQWWPKDRHFFGFIWRGQDKMAIPKEDYWTTRIFGASRPMGCDNALTLWTSGDVGKLVETLPEDVVKRKAMALLRRFMGAGVNIPEPTGIVRSTWYSNPYTRGSYSYDHLNSTSYPNARADLAAPVLDQQGRPKIMFAGEATNDIHFSTVHGAMETGYREAERFLNAGKSKI